MHLVRQFMGNIYYNISIALLCIQSFPVFLLFLVNVGFVLGETSSIHIAKDGLLSPYQRILKLNCKKIKVLFKRKMAVSGLFDFFLSFKGPEDRLVELQKDYYYKLYLNEDFLLESVPV